MTAERPLGPLHVAAIVVGAIVGVGIFFTPATLAAAMPSPAWVIGLWLLGGVASVSGALVFADLGALWPRAGGLYVFLREGFPGRVGDALSFLYGWLQLLVVQPGAMAIIAVVLVDHLFRLTGESSSVARAVGACVAIGAFTGANLLGLRTSGRIQIAVAALKLGTLLLLMGAGLAAGRWARLEALPVSAPQAHGWASWLILGMIPILFTFGGAYHATFVAGSVRDPERSMLRGLVSGIGAVLVGYVGVNVAYLALLGQSGLAASKSPAADAIALAFGPAAGTLVAAIIVVSAAGILNTVTLGFPFVIYAMAGDGVFFQAAGKLDPRTGRPARAVAVQGTLACFAVLVGSARVDVLLTGIAFADAMFQAAIAVVHLRRARGRAVASVTFFVIELGVALGCVAQKPIQSGWGILMLIVGVVLWSRMSRSA